jgi:Cupredoxin-like domain
MRKLIMLLLALGTLAVAPAASPATKSVALTRSGFVPARVTIAAGDTVTWTNNDTVNRSVVSDSGLFSSGILDPGESFSHTFTERGTFRYRDGTRTRIRGTVVARATPASVSLAASRTTLIFGGEVVLSGSLSSRLAGQPVTLVVRPLGGPVERVVLTTGAEGAFRYEAQPRIQTTYSAEYLTSASGSTTVNVRPRISLRKVTRTRYAVSVVAGRSFAGKVGYVARWSVRSQRWVTVRRFTLVQSRTSATVALATVRFRVSRKTKLRAFLSQAQAQPGYITGYSNFIRA